MRSFRYIALLVVAAISAGEVCAQTYPVKPLRFIVPWPPGGSNDFAVRVLAPRLGQSLGQQVVVDNRAGAAGIIGSDAVAKSTPDG